MRNAAYRNVRSDSWFMKVPTFYSLQSVFTSNKRYPVIQKSVSKKATEQKCLCLVAAPTFFPPAIIPSIPSGGYFPHNNKRETPSHPLHRPTLLLKSSPFSSFGSVFWPAVSQIEYVLLLKLTWNTLQHMTGKKASCTGTPGMWTAWLCFTKERGSY